jgi:hypothetical protein
MNVAILSRTILRNDQYDSILKFEITYFVCLSGKVLELSVNAPSASVAVKSNPRSRSLKLTPVPSRSPTVVIREKLTNSPAFKRTQRPSVKPTKSPITRTSRKPTSAPTVVTPAPSRLRQAPTKSYNPVVLPTVSRTNSPSSMSPTTSTSKPSALLPTYTPNGIQVHISPVSIKTSVPTQAPNGIQVHISPVSIKTSVPTQAPNGIQVHISPASLKTSVPTQPNSENPPIDRMSTEDPIASSNRTEPPHSGLIITPIIYTITNGTGSSTVGDQSSTNTGQQSTLPVPRAELVPTNATDSTADSSTAPTLSPTSSPTAFPTVVVPIDANGPYRWYFLPTAPPTQKPSDEQTDTPSIGPSSAVTTQPTMMIPSTPIMTDPVTSTNQTQPLFSGLIITPIIYTITNGTGPSTANNQSSTSTNSDQQSTLPVPRAELVPTNATDSTADSSTAPTPSPTSSPTAFPTVVVPIDANGPYRWYFLPTAPPTQKPSDEQMNTPTV